MKTFFYGVKLGAGLVAGKFIITTMTYAALKAVFGMDGLNYILGKGPKPSWMKGQEEPKTDEPAD